MKENARNTPNPRIVLAEDDHELRELLAFSLFRAGYNVTSCNNGLELLELLERRPERERYDLVLTDLRMPALTGLEVLEALHDLPERPPFICMTAFGDSETHTAARQLGAAVTIDKPFDIDRVIALINDFCPRKTCQPRSDGVAKSPPHGVTAFFQDLDILDVCLRP